MQLSIPSPTSCTAPFPTFQKLKLYIANETKYYTKKMIDERFRCIFWRVNKANKELEKHMKGSRKLHELIKFIYIIGHILSNVCLSRGITEEIFLHLSECYWQPCKQLARPPQLKCCFIWLFWVFWQYQFLTILCATIATWFSDMKVGWIQLLFSRHLLVDVYIWICGFELLEIKLRFQDFWGPSPLVKMSPKIFELGSCTVKTFPARNWQ